MSELPAAAAVSPHNAEEQEPKKAQGQKPKEQENAENVDDEGADDAVADDNEEDDDFEEAADEDAEVCCFSIRGAPLYEGYMLRRVIPILGR